MNTPNDGDPRLAAVQSQHPQSNGGVQTVASIDGGETVSIGPTTSDQHNLLHPTKSAVKPRELRVNYTGGLFSQLIEPVLSGGYFSLPSRVQTALSWAASPCLESKTSKRALQHISCQSNYWQVSSRFSGAAKSSGTRRGHSSSPNGGTGTHRAGC